MQTQLETLRNHYEQTQKSFDDACDQVGFFLDQQPTLYKISIVAIHFFRAITVFAMMEINPFSPLTSLAILIPASLLYRAAVERFCTFRFTLPALSGGLALWVAKQAVIALVVESAFSLLTTAAAGVGICSLAGYLVFVYSRSHFDVEKRMLNLSQSCCSMG